MPRKPMIEEMPTLDQRKQAQERRLQVHAEEFQQAISNLEEAYRHGMRAFVQWVAESWQHEDAEQWSAVEPYPGEDYQQGWNACLGTLEGALDLFLEEHMY